MSSDTQLKRSLVTRADAVCHASFQGISTGQDQKNIRGVHVLGATNMCASEAHEPLARAWAELPHTLSTEFTFSSKVCSQSMPQTRSPFDRVSSQSCPPPGPFTEPAVPRNTKDQGSSSQPTVQLPDGPQAVIEACLKIRGMLHQGGRAAPYQSRLNRAKSAIKLPNAEPENLSATFLHQLNKAMTRTAGVVVVGASVRRGCIELSLELVDVGGAPVVGAVGSSAAGAWAGTLQARKKLHSLAGLPVPELMEALGLGVPAPPAQDADSFTASSRSSKTLLSCETTSTLFATSPSVGIAPVAAPFTAFYSAPGMQPRAVGYDSITGGWSNADAPATPAICPMAVRPWCLLAGQAHATAATAMAWPHQGTHDGVQLQVQLSGVGGSGAADGNTCRFVAQAGGRSCAAQVVPGSWQVQEHTRSKPPIEASPVPVPRLPQNDPLGSFPAASFPAAGGCTFNATCTVVLEGAGPLLAKPGLLVLECWQGDVMCGCVPVLVVGSGAVAAELASFGASILEEEGKGEREREGEAGLLQQGQHTFQELLTDLGRWVEFCDAHAQVVAATPAEAGPCTTPSHHTHGGGAASWAAAGSSLDISTQLVEVVGCDACYAEVMRHAAQGALEFLCDTGLPATAKWFMDEWMRSPSHSTGGAASLAAALVAPCGAPNTSASHSPLTLLHLAVRSGQAGMVEVVITVANSLGVELAWVGSDSCPISPLHLAALQLAEGDGVAEWLLATQAGCASAWFDASGPLATSAATLADTVGSSHLTLMAAATLSAAGTLAPAADTHPPTSLLNGNTPSAPTVPSAPAAAATRATSATLPVKLASQSLGGFPNHPAGPSHLTALGETAAQTAASKESELAEADLAPMGRVARVYQAAVTGFRSRDLERRYSQHVALRSLSVTRIFAGFMVAAHLIVLFKSGVDVGVKIQAVVGASGYLANFVLSFTAPAFLIRNR